MEVEMGRNVIEIPKFMQELPEKEEEIEQSEKPPKKSPKKTKKKRKIGSKIAFAIGIILSILAGHTVAKVQVGIQNTFNLMNRESVIDMDDVEVDHENLVSENEVLNILLVGADKRAEWAEKGRSDSVMIATLDNKNKRLKITSVMRDLYVTIPEHGEDRFNAAYSYGGVELLYKTIAQNFNLKLDGFVIVDFEAFKSVINTIGGVEVTLTEAEHKYLINSYKTGSIQDLVPGTNVMNGSQALAYTRIRQDAHGDFGRTQRQRNVLQAIFTKAKSMPLSKLKELINKLMPYLTTDLNDSEIISYMMSVLMMGTTEIDQLRIPVDDSFTQDRIRNMAVLVPDLEKNKKELNYFIFEYKGE